MSEIERFFREAVEADEDTAVYISWGAQGPCQHPLFRVSPPGKGPSATFADLVALNSSRAASVLKVAELAQKQRDLELQVRRLELAVADRPTTSSAVLEDLNSTYYEVVGDISIAVEAYTEETVARWPEVGLYGAGTCEADAIAELKSQVVALVRDLEAEDEKNLGPTPLGWRRVLSKVVRKRA
jgi:hypothetical protein